MLIFSNSLFEAFVLKVEPLNLANLAKILSLSSHRIP